MRFSKLDAAAPELIRFSSHGAIKISLLRSCYPTSAFEFMNGDPAVLAGVLAVRLHPFSAALGRKNLE
jgi:hypothetical protein